MIAPLIILLVGNVIAAVNRDYVFFGILSILVVILIGSGFLSGECEINFLNMFLSALNIILVVCVCLGLSIQSKEKAAEAQKKKAAEAAELAAREAAEAAAVWVRAQAKEKLDSFVSNIKEAKKEIHLCGSNIDNDMQRNVLVPKLLTQFISCKKCNKLAYPLEGTTKVYKCAKCENQFPSVAHHFSSDNFRYEMCSSIIDSLHAEFVQKLEQRLNKTLSSIIEEFETLRKEREVIYYSTNEYNVTRKSLSDEDSYEYRLEIDNICKFPGFEEIAERKLTEIYNAAWEKAIEEAKK